MSMSTGLQYDSKDHSNIRSHLTHFLLAMKPVLHPYPGGPLQHQREIKPQPSYLRPQILPLFSGPLRSHCHRRRAAPHRCGSIDNGLEILAARDWVGLLGGCGRVMARRQWRGVGLVDGEGGDVIKIWGTGEIPKSGLKLALWEDIMER